MVNSRPGCLDHLSNANRIEGNIAISESLFRAAMPTDRIVLRMSRGETYNCNVWMSNRYIYEEWSQFFEILQIANNGHTCFQSPVIMRPLAEQPRRRPIPTQTTDHHSARR
jgi:hypothetical protein